MTQARLKLHSSSGSVLLFLRSQSIQSQSMPRSVNERIFVEYLLCAKNIPFLPFSRQKHGPMDP